MPVWTKGAQSHWGLRGQCGQQVLETASMQARLKADNGDRTPTASVTTLENSPRIVIFYVLKWETNTISI